MKLINLLTISFLLALSFSQLPSSQEMAVRAIAEKLSNTAADKINETPQVEEKGGIRQQVLHKGANLASKTLIDKGVSLVMTAAAKYPMVAVAAPVALPVAKAVAGAIVLNQVHKKINSMLDKKNSTATPEEAQAEEEARNERGEKASGVLGKAMSFFKKDEGAKEESPKEEGAEEPQTEGKAKAAGEPKKEEPEKAKEEPKKEEPKKEVKSEEAKSEEE